MNISYFPRLSGQARLDAGLTRRVAGRVVTCALLVAAVGMAGAAAGPAALAASSSRAASSARAAGPPPRAAISWSVSPASRTAPDFRTKYTYNDVKPGATITDHIAVLNRGSQSASFELYGTDAIGTTPSNVLELLPATATPTDIGSWVTLPHGVHRLSIILPAGKGVIEPFTIVVPHNASPGDHVGAVVGQVSFNRTSKTGQVITENQRIAAPVYMRVAGPLNPALSVESVSAGLTTPLSPWGEGSATVSYTVHNTGNIMLAGTQNVTVTGPFGQTATVALKSLPTVLPGRSVRLTAHTSGLYPAGPMTAHVRLGPTAPPGSTQLAVPMAFVSGSASLFAAPWAAIVLILLIVAIVVGYWWFRRSRQSRLAETMSAVADHVRKETEKRLLGKSAVKPEGKA